MMFYLVISRYNKELGIYRYKTINVFQVLCSSINDIQIDRNETQILGVFIPDTKLVDAITECVEYDDIMKYPKENPALPETIFDNLFSNDNEHQCLIIFQIHYGEFDEPNEDRDTVDSLTNKVVEMMKQKYSIFFQFMLKLNDY